MKKTSVLLLALFAFSLLPVPPAHSSSSQICEQERCRWDTDRRGRRVRICERREVPCDECDGDIICDILDIVFSCAPDVVNGNISATDQTLTDLIHSEQFAKEKEFNSKIEEILRIQNVEKKIAAYFLLVNVSGKNEIAYFIGARKHEYEKYASSLSQNTKISSVNAAVVVHELIKSLKGGIR